jgi:hypothetical protein
MIESRSGKPIAGLKFIDIVYGHSVEPLNTDK